MSPVSTQNAFDGGTSMPNVGVKGLVLLICLLGAQAVSAAMSFTCANYASGKQFCYHIPTNATAIIYVFHGAGGSASTFAYGVEGNRWSETMGYVGDRVGIVFIDSNNRNAKEWNVSSTTSSNPDLANLDTVRGYVNPIGGNNCRGLREFAVGWSNGGGFATFAGHYIKANGISIHGASGQYDIFSNSSYITPTHFVLRSNDRIVPMETINCPTCPRASLITRGVPSQIAHTFQKTPVYADDMSMRMGIAQAKTNKVHANLLSWGVLNASSYIPVDATADPATGDFNSMLFERSASAPSVVNVTLSGQDKTNINNHLRFHNADHEFNSDSQGAEKSVLQSNATGQFACY